MSVHLLYIIGILIYFLIDKVCNVLETKYLNENPDIQERIIEKVLDENTKLLNEFVYKNKGRIDYE